MKNPLGLTATIILFFCVGCTSLTKNPSEPVVLSDLSTLSKDTVVLAVKFVPQPDAKLCGLAVVDMLAGYYNRPLKSREREILTNTANAENGTTGAKIKELLERENYFAAILPGTLDHEITGLYHHLDNQRPLVVMLGTKNPEFFHYVIVIGYSPTLKNLVVLDPAKGSEVVSEKYFLQEWQKANRFMLVANPNNQKGVL